MAERYRPATPPRESIADTFQRLEAAIQIDQYELASVCRDQPTLFHQVSRELAYAISRRDAAKQDLDRTEAELTVNYREEAKRADAKITADEVKAAIKLDGLYSEMQDKLRKATNAVLDWQALKEAYLQRSYALNHMVDLYLANYYGNIERRETGEVRTRDAELAKEGLQKLRAGAQAKRAERGNGDQSD